MSILDQQVGAPQPTAAQRAHRVKQHIASTYRQTVHAHQHGMKLLWDTPEGITPQDVIDALGTDAAEAFALSASLATLIESIDADQVVSVPDGVTFTANPDGTVTLS